MVLDEASSIEKITMPANTDKIRSGAMNNIEDIKETRLGVAEYHLTKEEEKLSAVPMILGHTVTEDGRTLPGILLKQPLKDREKYEGVTADSQWKLLRNGAWVEAVFLEIEFKGAGSFKFCVDEFTACTLKWLKMLIASKGELALSDTLDVTVKGISVTNVPLDIPELLIRSAIKAGEQ
jgi:hypothetical protein